MAKHKVSEIGLKKAIVGSGGMLTVIAKKLNVTPETIKNTLVRFPHCKKLIEEERDRVVDTAEAVVISKMRSENEMIALKAAMWYLERKGGKGWTPNLEMRVNAGIDENEKERLKNIVDELLEGTKKIQPKIILEKNENGTTEREL